MAVDDKTKRIIQTNNDLEVLSGNNSRKRSSDRKTASDINAKKTANSSRSRIRQIDLNSEDKKSAARKSPSPKAPAAHKTKTDSKDNKSETKPLGYRSEKRNEKKTDRRIEKQSSIQIEVLDDIFLDNIHREPEPATLDRVLAFSQELLPYAGNELTDSDRINSTRKVLKREKKLLKSGAESSKESSEYASVFVPSGRKSSVSGRESDLSRTQSMGRIFDDSLYNDSVFPIRGQNYIGEEYLDRLGYVHLDDYKESAKHKTRVRPAIKWIVIAVIVIFSAAGFLFSERVFDDSPMDPSNSTKYEFTVDSETDDNTVGKYLVDNGMVQNELFYKIRAKFFDADYVEGVYEISPSYSTEKIINILSGYDYSVDE